MLPTSSQRPYQDGIHGKPGVEGQREGMKGTIKRSSFFKLRINIYGIVV